MTFHFVLTAEPTPAHAQMACLCAWSLRQRGGALAHAPITVTFNDAIHEAAATFLRTIDASTVVRPRLSTRLPVANKFNALWSPGVESADWVVLLDADTAILNDLAPLADLLQASKAELAAVPAHRANGRNLPRAYAALSGRPPRDLPGLDHPWFLPNAPAFNGGVVLLRGRILQRFRDEVVTLTERAFDRMRTDPRRPVHSLRLQCNRIIDRLHLPVAMLLGDHYSRHNADQIALLAACFRLGLQFEVLPHAYNWRLPDAAQGEDGPMRILHYLRGLYPFDRARLFDGDWLDEYARSDHPGRRALAEIVREFNEAVPEPTRATFAVAPLRQRSSE